MICEPWIYTVGPKRGQITWHDASEAVANAVLYANHERGKLKELDCVPHAINMTMSGLHVDVGGRRSDDEPRSYYSNELIGYGTVQFDLDSESSRLLKRAEFLKAVCEREQVEWLPCEAGRSLVAAAPPCRAVTTNQLWCDCEQCCKPIDVVKELECAECDGRKFYHTGKPHLTSEMILHAEKKLKTTERDTYTKAEIDEMFRMKFPRSQN